MSVLFAANARERFSREQHLHGHLKILGDAQRQVEVGTKLTPLQITHGLVVDVQRLGKLAASNASLYYFLK